MESNQLQVILTSGPENISRATLGFATALGAFAAQSEVVIFLTMEGAAWVDIRQGLAAGVPGFESIESYWNLLLDVGVRIEGCQTCVENYLRSQGGSENVTQRPGVEISGLSTAAMRSVRMSTVVF